MRQLSLFACTIPLALSVALCAGCGGEPPSPEDSLAESGDTSALTADDVAAEAALVVGPTADDARRADEVLRTLQASAPAAASAVDPATSGWREDPHEGFSR
jgi:hypothetical protein